MPELFTLTAPDEALRLLLNTIKHTCDTETIPTESALGRTTAGAVSAGESLPSFRKSTMDGYAVLASDTFGASESLPAYLSFAGEAKMGTSENPVLSQGEAILIHTGGMIPEGADAVVMIENTQSAGETEIEILRPVGIGENILQIGEDVQPGTQLFLPGHRLRSQDIGGLMALGLTQLSVTVPPKVSILSTGDEVVPPDVQPGPGEVRDINSYSIAGIVSEAGGVAERLGNFSDNFDEIAGAAGAALTTSDVLVISAGSSVSVRDLTAKVIGSLGEPGVLIHGIAIKPGKPTIFAVCGGKPVIGLPGNPVSALVAAKLFLTAVIRFLLLDTTKPPQPAVRARLCKNINSAPGKIEYSPVRLVPLTESSQYEASPVFGKSNLIYTLVHADGLVRVPAASNGLPAGEEVEVILF